MKTFTTFNGWIMSKIVANLVNKEGCVVEKTAYTYDGIVSLVRDAFGYRYEIQVKTLSRIEDKIEKLDSENPYLVHNNLQKNIRSQE